MKSLGTQGVSNDRLDEVSDYYRFQPQSGKIWTHKPAKAHALIVDGKIERIVVTDPGHGYCSAPKIVVLAMRKRSLKSSSSSRRISKRMGAIKEIK